MTLRAPFPWFGGKRRVADVVWRAFGQDVPNYIEPFAGSLAVLLARPGGAGKIETVNDRDRYLANFWRAATAWPDEVASWCDWPVNEADLHARHAWLVAQSDFRDRMHVDPDFCDVRIAGWWVWGICQWIGGGWCVEPRNHKHPKLDGIGKGVHSDTAHRKMPNVDAGGVFGKRGGALRGKPRPNLNGGQGVHAPSAQRGEPQPHWKKRPDLHDQGKGVHASGFLNAAYSAGRRPALSSAGQGIHLPALGNDRGLNGVSAAPCVEWFRDLAARLRRVRVACGDWRRVLGPSVLGKGKNVGGRRPCAVFLDPPYAHELRDPYLYSEDDAAISAQVREWALEHGDDPDLRICLAEGEHDMPTSWTVHAWKAARGYASESNNNRVRERLWFSPHCLPIETQQSLFAGGA